MKKTISILSIITISTLMLIGCENPRAAKKDFGYESIVLNIWNHERKSAVKIIAISGKTKEISVIQISKAVTDNLEIGDTVYVVGDKDSRFGPDTRFDIYTKPRRVIEKQDTTVQVKPIEQPKPIQKPITHKIESDTITISEQDEKDIGIYYKLISKIVDYDPQFD